MGWDGMDAVGRTARSNGRTNGSIERSNERLDRTVERSARSNGRSNGSIGVVPVGRSTDRDDDDDGARIEGMDGCDVRAVRVNDREGGRRRVRWSREVVA